jgi:hypothetical protein
LAHLSLGIPRDQEEEIASDNEEICSFLNRVIDEVGKSGARRGAKGR